MATESFAPEVQAKLALRAPGSGEQLRKARERRGVSLEEAAEATRITGRYLRALEEDAPVEAFPGPVYARFFLREYARYLGLDDRPLVAEFDEAHGEDLEPRLRAIPVDRAEPRGRGRVLAAFSTLALVALAVVSLTSGGDTPSPALSPTTLPETPASAASPEQAVEAPPPVRSIRLVLRTTEPSWMHIVADGHIIRSETVGADETIRVRAKRVVGMRFGNPDGVVLEVNGNTVAMERLIERFGQPFEVVYRVVDGELGRKAGADLGVLFT